MKTKMINPLNKDIIVLPHLGMGDHITVHSAILKIYHDTPKFNNMYIITWEKWVKNLQFMYRDLDKIKFLTVPDYSTTSSPEVQEYLNTFKESIIYNCWWYNTPDIKYQDECVMTSLGYTYEDKFNFFKIERDIKREEEVFNKIIGNNDPYIFVADDPLRNYVIDPFKISNLEGNTRVIKSCDLLDYTMFDLLSVIEKAKETHVMHSAFFLLIDHMSLNKIYLHNSYLNKINPIETYGGVMTNFLNNRNITHV
jgi:hypothetical protein